MTLRQKIFLLFNKKKAVCGLILDDTRKWHVVYGIPDKNQHIHFRKKNYIVTKDGYTMKDGLPTYVYNHDNPEPLELLEREKPAMTTDDYTTAIKSKAVSDIFGSFEEKMPVQSVLMIMAIVIVAAVIGTTYYMMEQITPLIDKVNELQEMVRILGGGE